MKKALILIGIIILVIVIGIVALLVLASKMQSAPTEYWNNIKSDSEIENKYNKFGIYEVETKNIMHQKMKEIRKIIFLRYGTQKKYIHLW